MKNEVNLPSRISAAMYLSKPINLARWLGKQRVDISVHMENDRIALHKTAML